MRNYFLTAMAMLALPATAYASCPASRWQNMKGVAEGAYPQQYELSEFEAAANCMMSFSANPDIAALNSKIKGNRTFRALADRIPAEPLVVVPYDSVGKYGVHLMCFRTPPKQALPASCRFAT